MLAIPLSLALSVIVLRLLGGTINTMTLGGMAIAIGALVDDAIIVVENVHRRLRDDRGHPPDRRRPPLALIRDAAREIRDPILNATLIISIVFVPLFFLSGVEGRMLRPLGLAYIVSILASLLVAVTVTPALCHMLLPGDRALARTREPWLLRGIERIYGRVLDWTLRRSGAVLGGRDGPAWRYAGPGPGARREFLPEFQEGTLTLSVVSLRAPRWPSPMRSARGWSANCWRIQPSSPRRGAPGGPISTSTRRAPTPPRSTRDSDLSGHKLAEVMAALRADLAGSPGPMSPWASRSGTASTTCSRGRGPPSRSTCSARTS